MEKINWERLAAVLFCLSVGAVLVFFAWKYLIPILLPFFFAWLLSLAVRPLALRLSGAVRIPRKICAALLFLLFLTAAVLLAVAACRRLAGEVSRLLSSILSGEGGVYDFFDRLSAWIGALPFFRHDPAAGEKITDMVTDLFRGALARVAERLPALAADLAAVLPSALLSLVVALFSGFYFCVWEQSPAARLASFLPARWREKLPAIRAGVKRLSWNYLRAYLLLLLLTFCELFAGFSILGVNYAFLLAILTAFVDLLPVLGVGTVLIPWAVVSLFRKNFYLGFGLLILYAVTLIARQISEPHLLGKTLGLRPFATLFAGFAGWKLFGILGMALGPAVALLCKLLTEKMRSKRP